MSYSPQVFESQEVNSLGKDQINPVLLKKQNLNVISVREANVSYHETWYIDSRNTILNLGCPRKENMIIWDGGST